jgi:phosphoglycerate dehydrogenase-like enzyme
VTGILLSKAFIGSYGRQLDDVAQRLNLKLDILHLPDDPHARLGQAECDRVELTMQSRDVRFSDHFTSFGAALIAANNLRWAHFHSTAIEQHVFVAPLLARGVKLTTSAGSNAEPVAHTAIGGLLMLARKFPHWIAAQQRRAWEPLRGEHMPADLRGQTVAIVGLGNIGMPVAQFCHALGMHVIGIRRTPRQDGDSLDEIYPLSGLPEVWPRCQWVILACPYTKDTHHIINADSLSRLPRGAALINVARGRVADEPAMIDALKSGQLGGAYLDVFEQEPLPAASPLWGLPNVIITPHNAAVSAGNEGRAAQMFLLNLEKWARGEPLLNPHTA